jgi:hypothetical protein
MLVPGPEQRIDLQASSLAIIDKIKGSPSSRPLMRSRPIQRQGEGIAEELISRRDSPQRKIARKCHAMQDARTPEAATGDKIIQSSAGPASMTTV